ncbi:MAG: transposase [Chloroflexota bacterium]|nr:transposase [Chloroflexota bacterium]
MLIPKIIGYAKMNAAKRINQSRNTQGNPVWQRNYYERVIRDENESNGVRQYIADNPANWDSDEENPNANPPQS